MAERAPSPSHRQLQQWVADHLRADILAGVLAPGEWLRQERLAQEYGVSQMPVREALKKLAAEGLVEHVPYRGVRVVEFSPEDVEDLYACRAFIESMAARFAALDVTDEELVELADLQQRMAVCKTPEDIVEYRELNRRFHSAIFAASRRSYLVRTLAQLWAAFPTMLWSNVPRVAKDSLPSRDQPDIEEHAAIVAALQAHDPDAAERAVRRHIEAAGHELLEAVRGER
ncbi:MAG TPA: GntR family transcriptional regulator [Thermoanaerobaculaceae bacterium]|nr:GntR family transcriptional regulator [Thermoanaerobaculaceae bacterium]